jgi:transcriptional regulator with XRE-family HTH domain
MNGSKIRMIRELRGLSQENIAQRLGITQTTYSRIENNQTKLDTAVLSKLAKELGVTTADILSNEPTLVNFSANKSLQNHDRDEFFFAFQKDLIEKIIALKDKEIEGLKMIINGLTREKESLIKMLQRKTMGK